MNLKRRVQGVKARTSIRRNLSRRLLVLLAAFACVLDLAAATGTNYLMRNWQTEDGLPQSSVTAILQSRTGYLWLGTYGGVVRFDGVRFKCFDTRNSPTLPNNRITSLFEDASGTLWIGHETGDLSRFKDGRIERQQVRAAWSGGKITGLGTDAAGDLWLFNKSGSLARVRDGLVLPPRNPASGNVLGFTCSPQGRIWVVRDLGVFELQGGSLKQLEWGGDRTNRYVQGISAESDGSLLVAADGELLRWRDGKWEVILQKAPWGVLPVIGLCGAKSGGCMAGTGDHGFYIVSSEGATVNLNRSTGLPHEWVRCLAEDSEGNVWLGVGSAGLVSLRPSEVSTVQPPDRWQARAVLSVTAARDGSLWVGTEGAGIYRRQAGAWTRFGPAEGLAHQFVWSVSEDALGRIWAGTWAGGVFLWNGVRFEEPPGLESLRVPTTAFLHGGSNEVWIGTEAGLLHYLEGRTNLFGREQGLTLPDVRSVVRDQDGAVWFGMSGGGLGCLRDGAVRQWRKADGLADDFVQCLHLDRDGALWIGTFSGGLNRLQRGRFARIGPERGLPGCAIYHIQDDGHGYFWLSSNQGILRVSKEELGRCADGSLASIHCLAYGKGDGLPTLECSGGLQPAGCQSADGQLWFPTPRGLVALDPQTVHTNPLAPPVVIEELLVEGQPVEGATTGEQPVVIAPGRQRFEFLFTGLSFVVPEKVRFKYRLEGLEAEWQDAGTRRSANYGHLSPGNYTFRVIACNNNGVWNEQGASLAMNVQPYLWQTAWFRALAVLAATVAVGGLVWFDTRRRMRRKLERLERQRAIERERARIARDIHDDLGASLTRISLLSQSASSELDHPERAREELGRIYQTARDTTRAMDEIVWAVNPEHDTLESLIAYLNKYAQEFLRAAGLRCRLDLPTNLPAWPITSEVRHNLFLAFKQALQNIVKHAAATEVRIAFTLHQSGFTLELEDNGCGFDPANPPTQSIADPDRCNRGHGLANLRQRLADIGGECDIRSAPGRGTKVSFCLRSLSQKP